MSDRILNELAERLHDRHPEVTLHAADLRGFFFEQRVRMNCFYCKKYDHNWKCPPRIPQLDYATLLSEYDCGAFVMIELPYDDDNFTEIRTRSTNELHRALLFLEHCLWELDFPMALSFLGGSCKLCKNGCGAERCNNPEQARVPLEATGINVVKTVETQLGIHLGFPPDGTLRRVGLLLW